MEKLWRTYPLLVPWINIPTIAQHWHKKNHFYSTRDDFFGTFKTSKTPAMCWVMSALALALSSLPTWMWVGSWPRISRVLRQNQPQFPKQFPSTKKPSMFINSWVYGNLNSSKIIKHRQFLGFGGELPPAPAWVSCLAIAFTSGGQVAVYSAV